MPNKNYQRGVRYERKTQKILNMPAIRTAGSHGVFDVIGYSANVVRFIQCKATKNKKINVLLYKKEIEQIANEDTPINTTKELWIFGNRKLQKVWIM